ncbi:MAG: apolipoprotein N-acyltransferase [Spirochaetia bacterium]|nr:apolipoprotein N-acyltransferase [Spirochaetia bacterium]
MSGRLEKSKPLFLLFGSAILFALSFPSFISDKGFPIFGYIALTPMFMAIRQIRLKTAPLWGFLYGLVSYALFNYWLGIFYPPAIVIIPALYAVYYFFLFPALKLADKVFPKWGFLVQCIIWIGYEYLRTKGFLGYPYGILGYSQYSVPLVARLAALTGVWGVSALLVVPSALLANVLQNGVKMHTKLTAIAYGGLFVLVLAYGFATGYDYSGCPVKKAALIQQNIDPWQGGDATYREALRRLLTMSTQAQEDKAGPPDIVVWSETSFVPSIDWHTRYRTDPGYYKMVKELRDYMYRQTVPFVLGNNEGVLGFDEEKKQQVRQDHNSALLFERGEITKVYRKIHLVPFTEHFPYKKQLPFIYNFLVDWDTHFWIPGTEYTVFDAAGFRFSTPICFEDSFGDLSRAFVQNGAQVIMNLSNDGWAYSVPAEMQHMAMATFRAYENRRTVVRSTNSGITCVIDPSGRRVAEMEPFVEGYLLADVPVYDATTTLYTRWGDWFGALCAIAAALLLVWGLLLTTGLKYKKIK